MKKIMTTKIFNYALIFRQIPEQLHIPVYRISMSDYEQHHYDKTRLRDTGKLNSLSA